MRDYHRDPSSTIISAPSSTKNREQKRDPEMHRPRERQPMVLRDEGARSDSKTKLIHTAVVTPANVADATVLLLLHGEETKVWGDQAYRGQSEVIQECAPRGQDCTQRRYRYKNHVDEVERAKNRTKSQVRSKVEHVFGGQLQFGFTKVRYRGLRKNSNTIGFHCKLSA